MLLFLSVSPLTGYCSSADRNVWAREMPFWKTMEPRLKNTKKQVIILGKSTH